MSVRFCLSNDRFKLDFMIFKVDIVSTENATLSQTSLWRYMYAPKCYVLVWSDFFFMALQHILDHFGCGELTLPHCSWASLLGSLPVPSAHSFASNWQLLFLNQRKRENGVEMFSWPCLHERMRRTWGSNSWPLACQANTLPIELLCPAKKCYVTSDHMIFITWRYPLNNSDVIWTASSKFGTYRLCEQLRFRRARTFAARSYKQWVKRNLQRESQIPGPSEWLGMRS